ncbi:MAG: heat-inducible transcriptional repressor HrcA [Acidimicrobiales bacterium]
MLDERKAAILEAVVTEYVASAQPVGSAHVVQAPGIGVSPATVRNEMAALEHEGYLTQPHTSAGRIPTDKGYRFFVDRLAGRGSLGPGQQHEVREFFARAHGELERMLGDTSTLLSSLTNLAGVVVGPDPDRTTVRSAQLVALAPRVALVVLVLSNGSVEKHTLELHEELGEEGVATASAHLHAHLVGRPPGSPGSLPPSGDPAVDALTRFALAALGHDGEQPGSVYVGGASRMAEAFDAVETVRRVLGILEQSFVVVTLLEDLLERGLSVAIGTEHGVLPLAECAVVVAPYAAAGQTLGTVGVLGPTRMDYGQALAAVAVVSQRLGRRLAEA